MRRIALLFVALISSAWLWAQTPTGKTFSTIATMTSVDGSTYFVTLDGTPKVWKKFTGATLRAYVNSTVTSIANGSALAGISSPYEGDLAINTAKDTLWIRDDAAWIVFKAGTASSTPNLQNVLVAGNSANSTRITNLGTPIGTADASTKGYVDTQLSSAVDAANVYAANVAQLQGDSALARSTRRLRDSLARTGWVTQTDLANNSVGSNQIITGAVGADEIAASGVMPGSYTAANITVDQDGRVTSISNGSAGISPTDTLFFVKIGSTTSPINQGDTLQFSGSGGGGSGTVETTMSVTGTGEVGTEVKLVNDETSPGNNKYYGTDLSGTRGWYPNIFTESNQNLKTKTGIRSLTLGPADSLSANQFVITSRSDLAQRMGVLVSGDIWYIRNNANSPVAHFGSTSRIYGTLQVDGTITLNGTLNSNSSFTILPSSAGSTVNNFFGNGSSAASSNSSLFSRCQSSSGFARVVLQKTSGSHEVYFTLDASNNFVLSRLTEGNLLTNAVGSDILAFSSTKGLILPVGNTAQKSGSPVQGETRFTSTIKAQELHDGDRWWVGDRQENGSVSTSTNGSGAIAVTTGTFVNTTYTVFVQVTGATPYVTTVTSKTTTGFTVNFFDMAGVAVASTAVTFDWRISKN